MVKNIKFFFLCLAVFFGSVCFIAAKAEAANKVVWTTTGVYYEMNSGGNPRDVLVIEGYFTNNTDKYINYFYELNLTATITADIGAGYTGQVHGTFRDFEKMIEPYSEASHKFRIKKAKIIWPVDNFEVIQGYTKWKQSDAAG